MTYLVFICVFFQFLLSLLILEKQLSTHETDLEQTFYEYLSLFISLLGAASSYFKFIYKFRLRKVQQFYYPSQSFMMTPLFKYFLLEFIVMLIHPNPLFNKSVISFYNVTWKKTMDYPFIFAPCLVIVINMVVHSVEIIGTTKYNSN